MINLQKMIKPSFIAGIMLVMIVACNPAGKYEKEEKVQIQDYLNSHPELSFELKTSGLYYLDVVVGDGRQAITKDTAYFMYTGKYLNGTIFGTNVGTTDTMIYPVNVGYLIPGFDEGLTYMKEGGTSLLLMPSDLGYGNSGMYMPAFTPLLFEIMLARIVPGPGK